MPQLHSERPARPSRESRHRPFVTKHEMQGKVSWIEGYGVFVDVALPDGRTASGLIHKSELTWGVVSVPEAVVSVGVCLRSNPPHFGQSAPLRGCSRTSSLALHSHAVIVYVYVTYTYTVYDVHVMCMYKDSVACWWAAVHGWFVVTFGCVMCCVVCGEATPLPLSPCHHRYWYVHLYLWLFPCACSELYLSTHSYSCGEGAMCDSAFRCRACVAELGQ